MSTVFRRVIVCSCGLGLWMVSLPAVSKAAVLYSTGFEAPTFAAGSQLLGQDNWSTAIPPFLSPSAAVIATVTPKSGSQDLQVKGSNLVSDSTDLAPLDGVGSYRYPLNYTAHGGVVQLEVDTMLQTSQAKTTNDFWSQTLAARSGDGENLAEFGLSSDGVVEAYGSDSSTGDAPVFKSPINFNQWYHLTMDLNFGAHTASYYIDGNLLGTINDASTSDELLRGAVVAYAYPDSGTELRSNYAALYDNFSVTAVPEPSSILCITGLGVALLRRRAARQSQPAIS